MSLTKSMHHVVMVAMLVIDPGCFLFPDRVILYEIHASSSYVDYNILLLISLSAFGLYICLIFITMSSQIYCSTGRHNVPQSAFSTDRIGRLICSCVEKRRRRPLPSDTAEGDNFRLLRIRTVHESVINDAIPRRRMRHIQRQSPPQHQPPSIEQAEPPRNLPV